MANSSPSMSQWEPDNEANRIARPNSLIVRPEIPWKRQLMFGVLFGGWTLLMGGGLVLLYPEQRAVVVGCIATVVTVLLAGGAKLYLISSFSKLIVDRDALIVSAFGLPRTFSRGSLAQIARASLDVTVRSSFTLSYYALVSADGRVAFKLPAKWWPDAGIVGVAATPGNTPDREFL